MSALKRAPGLLVMLALLLPGFALGNHDFLSVQNLTNVALQSSVLMLLALPMTFVILTEGLDLSIGAVCTLASVVLAQVALATGSVSAAVVAGLAVGLGMGVGNGVLVAWLGLPPFVATLGTLGIAQGLALLASDGQSVVGLPPSLLLAYSGHVLGIPVPILLMLGAWAVLQLVLSASRFGTYVVTLGGNREALGLAGVNWRVALLGVYALAGGMAGLAGVLMTARLNAGHPTAGIGLEFDAIAAVAVGGTSFERGNGWLPGTVLGVLAIGVLRNGLNLLAVPSSAQVCCIGLMVIFAFAGEALRKQPA